MTDLTQNNKPSDEILVAFLDGELEEVQRAEIADTIKADTETAARFAFLSRSDLPFQQAFAPMLGRAPLSKLESMLEHIPSQANPAPARKGWNRRGFLAAAIGCVMVGFAADRSLLALMYPPESEDDEWRAAVADYVGLYTPETLADLADNDRSRDDQLRVVSDKLKLPLPAESISLPGIPLKRVQILQYEGKPLGQLAYLDPRHGPLALCIAASPGMAADLQTEQRHGMNVAYWSDRDRSFMLIGHNPPDQILALGQKLKTSLNV